MADCIECSRVNPIPICIQNLTIGTVTPDTDVTVYIRRISTGGLLKIDATSDGAGLVILDLTEYSNQLVPGSDYEVWITEKTGQELDRLTITIDACQVLCLLLTFEKFSTCTDWVLTLINPCN